MTTDPSLHLSAAYVAVKQQFPGEGRRRWKIRAADQFWGLTNKEDLVQKTSETKANSNSETPSWAADSDPFDLNDGPSEQSIVKRRGLIVRTDYTDDTAWEAFLGVVKEAEKEGLIDWASNAMDEDQEGDDEDDNDEDAEDGEGDEEGAADTTMETEGTGSSASAGLPPSVFHVIAPPPGFERAVVEGASNLHLLRLFNDLEIIQAPRKPPPPDTYYVAPKTNEVSPNNRLVEKFGLKEVYPGRVVWVYDADSNKDQSVRLINPGDDGVYGSSTGDSWRARASHIWELQVNLDSGIIRIDFGGADRWTRKERLRNYEEVGVSPS